MHLLIASESGIILYPDHGFPTNIVSNMSIVVAVVTDVVEETIDNSGVFSC